MPTYNSHCRTATNFRATWLAVPQLLITPGQDHKVFMENACLEKGLDFSSPGGRLCNPGHSIEVSWFLLHLNRILKDPEIRHIALKALIGALEIGWEKDFGGILYMLDIEGKPLMDTTVTAENKLWWPMSEGTIFLE